MVEPRQAFTLSTGSYLLARIGLAVKGSSAPAYGDVEVAIVRQQSGKALGTRRVEVNPIPLNTTYGILYLPVGGPTPVMNLTGIKTSVLAQSVWQTGTMEWRPCAKLCAIPPDEAGTWTLLGSTWNAMTVENAGVVNPPTGYGSSMYLQAGVALRVDDRAMTGTLDVMMFGKFA